jgi:hypothetical protein
LFYPRALDQQSFLTSSVNFLHLYQFLKFSGSLFFHSFCVSFWMTSNSKPALTICHSYFWQIDEQTGRQMDRQANKQRVNCSSSVICCHATGCSVPNILRQCGGLIFKSRNFHGRYLNHGLLQRLKMRPPSCL